MSDIKTILSTIDDAVSKLTSIAASKQPALLKEVLAMVKKLDTRGDTLLSNINNLKLINNIKVRLERLMIDDKYKEAVKEFAQAYNDIQDLHNEYFASFASKPAMGKIKSNQRALNILKNTAIESTVNNLTETGLQAGVTEGLRRILLTNVNTGGSYADLTDQLRNYLTTDDKSDGALEKYVKTYSVTAINQFSREYGKSIADDLQLYWYMYDGSLLTTSREFCIQCCKKKYIHASEFDTILAGDFGDEHIHINKATELPDGLLPGTDATNLVRRAGGWNCGHQMIAVDDVSVPNAKKEAVYATAEYKKWKAKNY